SLVTFRYLDRRRRVAFPLHTADPAGRGEPRVGLALRGELMRDVAAESTVGDRLRDGVIVELLRVIDVMPPGYAPGMEVPDPLPVLTDGADEVPLHDLHVVDVVEKLDAGRSYFLHYGYAEGRVIALVVGVIDLAVEELDTHRDAVLLRDRRHPGESRGAGGDTLPIAQSPAVDEHRDHVRHARPGRKWNRRAQLLDQHGVVRRVVEAVLDEVLAAARVAHRAGEARGARRLPFVAM